MGRRRHHKKKKKTQKDGGSKAEADLEGETTFDESDWLEDDRNSASTVGVPGWTWKERRDVLRYLEQYKFGCECVYAGIEPECQNVAQTIGFVEFPILTREILKQPYLRLPKALTAKNRKMIHECCAESFLFHITIGERHTIFNRTLAISIFVDGFDSIENLEQHVLPRVPAMAPKSNDGDDHHQDEDSTIFYHPLIHNYRPWFTLKNRPWLLDSNPNSTTQSSRSLTPVVSNTAKTRSKSLDSAGKRLVDALIDNPESCLRDDLDALDFALWDTADLSSVPPPSSASSSSTTTEGGKQENNHHNEWTLVDSAEKMNACIADLQASEPTEIGFDLESLNKNKFCQLTCLLQITSNAGHDYVIDTLAPGVWELVGPGLAPLFANPRIVKIGHSIGGLDVRSLHRDFGIFVVNAFDTYEAARVLGLDSLGLASVCAHYGMKDSDHYKELKAEYQATDWRLRPLTKPMLEYGRYDVHYLLQLRWLLMRDLTRAELYDRTQSERDEEAVRVAATMASALAQFNEDEDEENDENWNAAAAPLTNGAFDTNTVGSLAIEDEGNDRNDLGYDDDDGDENDFDNNDPVLSPENPVASVPLLRMQPNLMKAISRSQERCRDLWSGKEEPYADHPMYINILHRARRDEVAWTPEHLKLYKKLIEWREQFAVKYEMLPGFVAPLEFLIPVALQRPQSLDALRRVSYRFPELLEEDEDCLESLLKLVRETVTGDLSTVEGNDDEALLRYHQAADPTTCARIRAKREKLLKRRRRSLRSSQSQSLVGLVDWRSAGLVLAVVIAAVAVTAHRWRRK